MGQTTEVRPFYCGSQGADWQTANCENCRKSGHYTDASEREWVWVCDIQRAIDEAYIGDGNVSAAIASRMGYTPNAFCWPCSELEPIVPVELYFESLKPRPTRLMPLWRRVARSLAATWNLWIKPWDREDHDCYEGLRSPVLAWQVGWMTWHDARVPVAPKEAK